MAGVYIFHFGFIFRCHCIWMQWSSTPNSGHNQNLEKKKSASSVHLQMSLGFSGDFITCQLALHSMLIYLYFILECFAPARLTRVIAQASLGSPACLCGFACWVGVWDIWIETSKGFGSLVSLAPRDSRFCFEFHNLQFDV